LRDPLETLSRIVFRFRVSAATAFHIRCVRVALHLSTVLFQQLPVRHRGLTNEMQHCP
jgi:hypothetical protein